MPYETAWPIYVDGPPERKFFTGRGSYENAEKLAKKMSKEYGTAEVHELVNGRTLGIDYFENGKYRKFER